MRAAAAARAAAAVGRRPERTGHQGAAAWRSAWHVSAALRGRLLRGRLSGRPPLALARVPAPAAGRPTVALRPVAPADPCASGDREGCGARPPGSRPGAPRPRSPGCYRPSRSRLLCGRTPRSPSLRHTRSSAREYRPRGSWRGPRGRWCRTRDSRRSSQRLARQPLSGTAPTRPRPPPNRDACPRRTPIPEASSHSSSSPWPVRSPALRARTCVARWSRSRC